MRCHRFLVVVVLGLTPLLAIAAPPAGTPPPTRPQLQAETSDEKPLSVEEAARIDALVAQLDDDRFAVREQAQRALREAGLASIPALERAAQHESPEVRHRARQLVLDIQHQTLLAAFQQLAGVKDDARIDVERGMWLIARIESPQLRFAELSKQLDALAEQVRADVRDRFGADTRPRDLPPLVAVEALSSTLFNADKGLGGNPGDYDNPDNSLLDKVLATRKGLPILLSHVMVAVARRVEVPIAGIPFPQRYMARYHTAPGVELAPIIIDVYNGGKILTEEEAIIEAARMNYKLDPDRHLAPSLHRDTLARMLRNLGDDYQGRGDLQKADRVAAYLHAIVLPENAE